MPSKSPVERLIAEANELSEQWRLGTDAVESLIRRAYRAGQRAKKKKVVVIDSGTCDRCSALEAK
jgi:hypothetical protein